jgi:hypothetical protein
MAANNSATLLKLPFADYLLGELGKKAFDQIEPRTAGRGKMHDKARMAFEPLFYLGMLYERYNCRQ